MVFAFLFGLSMDYEVFILVADPRGVRRVPATTDEAVVAGLGRTGRLVTSAALILFLAFAAIGSRARDDLKILATGLGAGILIDAMVVRALLVPALVSLFGRWNWWLPSWPARLLRVQPSAVRDELGSPAWRRPSRGAGTSTPRSSAASRSGSSLRLAVRRAPRPAAGAGHVLHVARRAPAGDRHACPGRRAARLPQRLPAPRLPRRRGRGPPRDAPVPVPRVDVRARRLAAGGAPLRRGAGLRKEELGLVPAAVDTWGPFVFVNPDRDAGAARRGSRLDAGAGRRAGPRRRRASLPHALGDASRGELEDRAARTSSSATTAPSRTRLHGGDRRRRPRRTCSSERPLSRASSGRSARAAARDCTSRASCRAASSTSSGRTYREHLPGPAEPLDRARWSRGRPSARTASSTTSSDRTSTRRGSTS